MIYQREENVNVSVANLLISPEKRAEINTSACGVFFDEDWQAYSREVLQKDDLMGLYDRTFSKITLESAKNIARPQIDRLKNLLQDSIAPGGET